MKIIVTAEDIANGVRCDATACPIARAINRVMADRLTRGVSVLDTCVIRLDTDNMSNQLPVVAQEFIVEFDEEGVGKPFEFELDDF